MAPLVTFLFGLLIGAAFSLLFPKEDRPKMYGMRCSECNKDFYGMVYKMISARYDSGANVVRYTKVPVSYCPDCDKRVVVEIVRKEVN